MRTPVEIVSDAKDKVMALPSQTILSVKMIAGEIIDLYAAHPRKMLVLTVIELWIHSLVFQHLTELKELKDLIPFLGS